MIPLAPSSIKCAGRDALLAALALAVPAAVACASGQLLLFPSLAPTAVMLVRVPEHEGSRAHRLIAAHLIGLGSAFLMVWLLGIAFAPSVFEVHGVSIRRATASVLALLLGTFLEIALNVSHPPSAATTLLAALGSFKPTVRDTRWVVIGVVLVAAAGELAMHLRRQRALA